MDALVAALDEPDGFLRYKAIAAIERLVRDHPGHRVSARRRREAARRDETSRYCNRLTLHDNLQQHDPGARGVAAAAAPSTDKMTRALDRHLPPARPAVPGRRHRRGALRHRARRLAPPRRGRSSTSTTCSAARSGAACCRCSTTRRWPRRCATPTALLKSRPRELEDTLAQLVHDDDPVVAAAAIHFVAQRRLWALADDLEYVVSPSHDADDAAVVEAAAWALRQRPQPTPAGDAGVALPAVELVDRVRAIPLFEFVSVDELFRIASRRRRGPPPGRPRACFAPARRRRTWSSCSTARSAGDGASRHRCAGRPRPRTRCSRARPRHRRSGPPRRSSACASPPPTCSRCCRTTCCWPRDCSGCCSRPERGHPGLLLRPADHRRATGRSVDAAMAAGAAPALRAGLGSAVAGADVGATSRCRWPRAPRSSAPATCRPSTS